MSLVKSVKSALHERQRSSSTAASDEPNAAAPLGVRRRAMARLTREG